MTNNKKDTCLTIPCPVCGGFGKVHPLKDKIDYSSLVYCRCRGEKAGREAYRSVPYDPYVEEHYYPLKPEDYDYPLSGTFRGWSYEHCGMPDPGYVPPEPEPEEPKPREIIHRMSNMSSRDFARLMEHDRVIKYLLKKKEETPGKRGWEY